MSALEDKLKSSAADGGVPCVQAWDIAAEMGVGKMTVGEEMDRLGLRIHDCQLGCFGKAKATHAELAHWEPPQSVLDKIDASLRDGKVPCAVMFKIAGELGVPPREVGDAASKKEIRVSKCQLGAFP